MFVTFWLRSKNRYYNVDTVLLDSDVFKKEIKTNFILNRDELISANQFGWFKAERNQRHGVVCESSILAQQLTKSCKSERKVKIYVI